MTNRFSSNRRRVRRTLEVQKLEGRDLFAVLAYSQGTLTVNMNEAPTDGGAPFVSLSASSRGELMLNSRSTTSVAGANGRPLPTSSIVNIVVNGSEQRDIVDFTRVTKAAFPQLRESVIYGRGGNDTIRGAEVRDRIFAGSGDDRVFGMGGDDLIEGEQGDDQLWGDGSSANGNPSDGNDVIFGGIGNDILNGGGGNDSLYGGSGDDLLIGDGGDDQLFGEDGKDKYDGGVGFDTVWFDSLDPLNPNRTYGVERWRRR